MLSGRKKQKRRADDGILDAAEHVFGWKGYQLTTMEILAREAGLSIGSLYNVFKSKEDIYGQVARRIGECVLRRIEPLAASNDPDRAVLELIRLRLYNYVNDRLFFQPFCTPAYLGIQPEPARLCAEVNRLYQQYVDLVEKIFARAFAHIGQKPTPGIKMSVCLEGMLTAFMSYWSNPLQSDSLAKVAHHMRTVLLHGMAPLPEVPTAEPAAKDTRTIYISRYDLDRLNELLEVVKSFGKKESQEDARALAEELSKARVANPRDVPPDVITMNSRLRVLNVNAGTDRVCTLVFPRDASLSRDNVSVLNPLGTALLGRRLGDVFTVGADPDSQMYEAMQMLYQPEAAGDYHL